ncbi:hypothetical protein R84B8_02778 [Treponema sp. R8-4-B8]
MILVGIIIGVIILAAMIYLAVDKKSSFVIRLASLGAIALMFIALIICIIIVVSDDKVPVDPSTLIVGAPPPVKEKKNNLLPIILSIVIMLGMFIFIAVLAMKEHKKNLPKKGDATAAAKPISNW